MSSSGGVLHTSLVVDVTTVQVDWLTVHRRLYNGTFPGPTLRIKAEDRVHLNLVGHDEMFLVLICDFAQVFLILILQA